MPPLRHGPQYTAPCLPAYLPACLQAYTYVGIWIALSALVIMYNK